MLPRHDRKSLRTLIILLVVASALLVIFGSFARIHAKHEPELLPPTTTVAAPAFVDVHAHLDSEEPAKSIAAALQAMTSENAAEIIFMPPPFIADDPSRYDSDLILSAVGGRKSKFAVLGGGGSLNVMIHQSVKSGDAGTEMKRRFRSKAEQILRDGASGFGEMAAEHFPGATPYQSAPPDHPLFLLLADVAAEHGVPIDLHMEAIAKAIPPPAEIEGLPQSFRLTPNIAAMERLLAHNRRAKIIWAHAGWDNTGDRTPQLCRRLLAAHPNLYMDIKIDPLKPGKNSPLADGGTGTIRAEWLSLFKDYPDRFVIGSDQHYPRPSEGPQRWESVVLLLKQLPPDLQRKIGWENAEKLYPRQHQ